MALKTFQQAEKFVSVPLRGLWFEIFCDCGIAVVGFEYFPSPCGVCGWKFDVAVEAYHESEELSVPLRGLWFEISYLASAL